MCLGFVSDIQMIMIASAFWLFLLSLGGFLPAPNAARFIRTVASPCKCRAGCGFVAHSSSPRIKRNPSHSHDDEWCVKPIIGVKVVGLLDIKRGSIIEISIGFRFIKANRVVVRYDSVGR